MMTILRQFKSKINTPVWYILLAAVILASVVIYSMIIPHIRLMNEVPIQPGYYANRNIFEKVPPSYYERWTAIDIAGVLVCFFMGLVCFMLGIARNINKLEGKQSFLLAAFLILFGLNLLSGTNAMQEYFAPVILHYVFWFTFFTYAKMIFLFYFLYLRNSFQKWAWPLLVIPIGYGITAFFMHFVFDLPFDMPTKLYTPMMIIVYMIFQLLALFGAGKKNMVVFFRTIFALWFFWLIYVIVKTRLGHYFSLALEYKNSMIIFSVFMVCFLVYVNIQEISHYKFEVQKLENNLLQNQISIILSQIQPHFLYNSLVLIQQLCKTDPKMAEETVVEFSNYLRSNLDSLVLRKPIPFERELLHVENYLLIEKKRFEERLHTEYDIKVKDFMLPALTLQAIVENAVRYGVTKKDEGGTVRIETRKTENSVVITVTDDGVGFNLQDEHNYDNQRLSDNHRIFNNHRLSSGIENVRSRLSAMCGGSLEITSKPGEGTTAVITIPLT